MNRLNWQRVLILMLLVINISFVIFFYNQKTSFHVDEMFSFGHANSSQGSFLVKGLDSKFSSDAMDKYLLNQWLDGSLFNNYITVQEDEKFNYTHIYDNLNEGVHPPLFYIFLHTICSFFPDEFSKWFGAMLNIPIWIVLLIMMYKLSGLFFRDKYLALLPVALYAYSQIGFNTVVFIRMYLLQTLWLVCLLYETILMIRSEKTSKKQWMLIFLYSLLGMLTQYNSIIASAIIGCVFGVNLIFQKRYKDLFIFAVIMLLSVTCLVLIFPQIINVMQHSSRANEVAYISNRLDRVFYIFLYDTKNYIDIYAKNYIDIYAKDLLSFNKSNGCVVVWITFMTIFYKYTYAKDNKKDIEYLLICIFLVCLYCSIFMPQMHIYNSRYVMMIMPVMAIITVYYLTVILGFLPLNVIKWLLSIAILLNSIFVDFNNRSPFSFQIYDPIIKEFEGKKIIWTGSFVSKFYTSIYIVKDAQNVVYLWSGDKNDIENTKSIKRYLDEADFLVNSNMKSMNTYNKLYIPAKAELSEDIEKRVDFIKTIKIGEFFYDIYKIKKQ